MKKRFGKLEANWPRLRRFLIRFFGGFDYEIEEMNQGCAITMIRWKGKLLWMDGPIEALTRLIQKQWAAGKTRFILDLEKITAVDLQTWGKLARILDAVIESGGKIRLCNVPDFMAGYMRMDQRELLVYVSSNQATALESLRQSQSE